MHNLFGFALDGLDVPGFLGSMRVVFAVVALWAVLATARLKEGRRVGRVVLGMAIAGHALAWFATVFPLPNLYAVNGSMDRENHLGWANVVAQGFSPLYTFQVKHLHFEPLWPLLTAIVAGFNLDRIVPVMHWAPLVAGLALLFAVRFTWLRSAPKGAELEAEASFAALGALLLLAVPGDFWGPFRNPWALTLLLKPNHTLGLALAPLAALAIARASNWKTRLLAGFVLQLVGWVFVIHMALLVAGLGVFVALSWITRRSERMKDLVDVATAVGVNLVIVSPYLVMLVVGYPFLQENDRYRFSGLTERPIEASLRLGIFFLLSAFAAWRTYREGSRLGRILSTQWLAAHLVWQAYPVLGMFGLAREQDELFYWCRFWTGLFAGAGVFRLAHRARLRLLSPTGEGAPRGVGVAAALSLVLLLPSLLPAWWDPSSMDRYYQAARQPIPDWIAEPTLFIRTRTPREAVFGGDRNYARWIAAYGARRVLLSRSLNAPNDWSRRLQAEDAVLHQGSPELFAEALDRYGLRYLLVTENPLEQAQDLTLDQLRARADLEVVYDRQFGAARVVILKILGKDEIPKAGAR